MIRVNDLQYNNIPRLIFSANTPERKGLAVKSYSLDIPNTQRNNEILGNLWGVNVLKPVTFEAEYIVLGRRLRGLLVISAVSKERARAEFNTGNGYLWQRMGGVQLTDINMSADNIVLNQTNVVASETGTPFVVFDLTDRGAFKTLNKIDISDRFPALQVRGLLSRIFNSFGVGVQFDEFTTSLADKYLLFTQDSNIRNSAEWLQEAKFTAGDETISIQKNDQAAGAMVWEEQLPITVISDLGNNWSGGAYTVPETGTYRFKLSIEELMLNFESDTGAPALLAWNSVNNRARFTFSVLKNGAVTHAVKQTIETITGLAATLTNIELDTFMIELQQGDIIEYQLKIEATVSFPSGGTESRFTQSYTNVAAGNDVSRWYGAGSTIEINKILPRMGVLEFLRVIVKDLNIDIFYNDLTNIVTLRAGRDQASVETLTAIDLSSEIDDRANIILDQPTDKALPPDSYYIHTFASATEVKQLATSRTYIGACSRLFGEVATRIPVLWQTGNPSDLTQAEQPPEQLTTGLLRILTKTSAASGNYTQTYGGTPAGEATITSVLQLVETNIRSLHIHDSALVRETFECTVKLDIGKLADLTYFKRPVMLKSQDINGHEGIKVMILTAEQVNESYFKIEAQTTALYSIDAGLSSIARERQVPSTSVAGAPVAQTGGGSTTLTKATGAEVNTGTDDAKYVTPKAIADSNVFRSEKAGQVNALTEKTTTVANNDILLIEDSQDSFAKKKVKFSLIRAIFDFSYFAIATANQFIDRLLEKTSLAADDTLLIEDSANSYNKKFVKWSSFINTLKTTFFGTYAGQFFDLGGKTTPVDADVLIIEDSANSYNKRKLPYANLKGTLKTYFDDFYNPLFWTAVSTYGIKTTKSVGIGADASDEANLYVFGDYVTPARIELEDVTNFPYSSILQLYRSTDTTAANQIGGGITWHIENANGNNVYGGGIFVYLSNATSGSEASEMDFSLINGTKMMLSNNKLTMNAIDVEFNTQGTGVVLKSDNGTRYRVTVDNSGNLIVTSL